MQAGGELNSLLASPLPQDGPPQSILLDRSGASFEEVRKLGCLFNY